MRETRGRKPKNGIKAMSVSERKADQRIRLNEMIQTVDSSEWTEAACLHVLIGKQWRGGVLDKAAWKQLGELRGFVTVTKLKAVAPVTTKKPKSAKPPAQATLPGLD